MDKQEYNKIGREVVKRYKEDILPRCSNFEEERIKIKNNSNLVIIAAVVISILICIISKGIQLNIIIFIIAVAILINLILAKNFENKVKSSIIQYFCGCFGNFKWVNRNEIFGYINESIFKDSNLFKVDYYTENQYDDVFAGEFHDVPFTIIEMESYVPKKSSVKVNGVNITGIFNLVTDLSSMANVSGHTSSSDYSGYSTSRRRKNQGGREINFKGVVIQIKINKNFSGNTVIRPDSLMHFTPDSKLRHTTFEDVQFEKKFDVFTTDEVEARYLITTAFMDRLNNLKMAFNIDKISCAFYNQTLLIGLHTKKDLFKFASINKSLTDYREFSQLFKEIMSIYEMIDYFKFGEKTKI